MARTGGPLFGSHFEHVPRVGRWASLGVCRDATAAFFPERGQRFDTAIALCRACPVVEPCRAYGLAHSSLKGIFGGLTEDERRRIRSESRRARPGVPGGLDRLVYDHLHTVLRYPVRTWASVAWAPERDALDALGLHCESGDYAVPPGRWELVVSPRTTGWELWARLLERDLASPRHRSNGRSPERVARASAVTLRR